MKSKTKKILGRAEKVSLPEFDIYEIPARIDTGAKTTSIWASAIKLEDGELYFTLFDKASPFYTGDVIKTSHFERVVVASSIGVAEGRFRVIFLIKLKGRKVRARVTLADRSQQAYPMLVGRNVLRGKFVVDVQGGKPLYKEERQRSHQLQANMAPED